MNLDELSKTCDGLEAIARQLFERDGDLVAAFFVFGLRAPDGRKLDKPAMFVVPWVQLGGDDKKQVRANQQRMADALCAQATVNIMEAWALEVSPERKGSIVHEVGLPVRPTKHPDRFEIVCMRGECREGVIHRSMRIERLEDGPPRLGETESVRTDRASALIEAELSLFAGYFPEPRGQA